MCMSKMYMEEVARDSSQGKSTDCSSIPSGFNSQHPYNGSQFETLALGDLKSLTRRIWRLGIHIV